MEVLEKLGGALGSVFGGIGHAVERGITSLFGSSNARYLKRLQAKVDAINELEPKYQKLTDEQLREQTAIFRSRLRAGETLDDLLIEAFAVCREAGRRFLGMRHYDVQMLGGMVLHSGAIAEMVTGEGKTLVATLPAYLNALEGKGVHVVTVNDYLARRDMEWMGPLYLGLGLTVGAIWADMPPEERQKAYMADITYGTNNEFGFDYLRDNMKMAARGDNRYPVRYQQVQGPLNYAIIDEVDNILIDEARTPLIISGPADQNPHKYVEADRIARQLKKGEHFEVKEKEHTCHLTDEGVRVAEKLAGVDSFFTAGNMEWPHLIDNALKAHYLYKRDVNYLVENGEVIIVDEFTGRKMPGRQWSDGLHQAVEAKEGVRIKEETQTLATITLQNFFKLYRKISGMTGTAMTEATEFWKIYKLDVIAIPTNRPLQRINHPDVIYLTESAKYHAIADEIERMIKWDVVSLRNNQEIVGTVTKETDDAIEITPAHTKEKRTVPRSDITHIQYKGRPVLVGTVSIEKSERLSELLTRRGIPHQVLNAKHHKREAEIVAQAGRLGAVTIATNMAGRGTDIILGGNPETMAWALLQDKYATRLDVPREEWDALVKEIEERENMVEEGKKVAALGGLHVIGTERHESRRIDNQLRGRCGRQGDPGSSRFYLSLEDDLMRIFAGDWVRSFLSRMGMKEDEAIESKMVSRRIEGAQKKVEERNFERRKHLLEYDEVMDEQRKRVYGFRQRILQGASGKQIILDMIDKQIEHYITQFLDRNYGPATFCAWAGPRLGAELNPHDFRDLSFAEAQEYAKDDAERAAEALIHEMIEENLPGEEDAGEWNWEALARSCNLRWQLNLRDRDLKKVGRDDLAEFLISQAHEAIQKIDLSEGERFLDPEFGIKSACGWVQVKFGIEMTPDEIRDLDVAAVKQLVRDKAREMYAHREAEYPVIAGLYHFSQPDANGNRRYDRDALLKWAEERFGTQIDVEAVKNKERDEVISLLIDISRRSQERASEIAKEAVDQVRQLFGAGVARRASALEAVGGNGKLESLSAWLKQKLDYDISADELGRLEREELEDRVAGAVEQRYRAEMRRLERQLLLQILDEAWKDHLLAMDHLRSSVGLVGYAQVDPKVEYKRVGMRIFEDMWKSIGERVTDLIFRMEQLDENFVSSTWVQAEARHDEAAPVSQLAERQQAAIENSGQGDVKTEPIRNRGSKVGRNDPCPCNSGKKYKNCCMRKGGIEAA